MPPRRNATTAKCRAGVGSPPVVGHATERTGSSVEGIGSSTPAMAGRTSRSPTALNEERSKLDAQWAKLQLQRDALSEECRRWELRQAELFSAAEQRCKRPAAIAEAKQAQEAEAPTSFSRDIQTSSRRSGDVLRRMGIGIEVDEGRAEAKDSVRPPWQPVNVGPQPPAGPAAASKPHADKEESVECCAAPFTQRICSSGDELGRCFCSGGGVDRPKGRSSRRPRVPLVCPRRKQHSRPKQPCSCRPHTGPGNAVPLAGVTGLVQRVWRSAISGHVRQMLVRSRNPN